MHPQSVNKLLRDKFTAFGIHFFLNAVLIGWALVLAYYTWFPEPYMEALGIYSLFSGMVSSVLLLGPVLTSVVFRVGKKKLKHDLLTIGVLQCLLWVAAAYWILQVRPVYIAGLGHRFDLIQAMEVETLSALPMHGPEVTGTRQAETTEERQKMLMTALNGKDYGHFPDYHAPLSSMREEVLSKALPINHLFALNIGREEDILQWLLKHKMQPEDVVFQGMRALSKDMAVIIKRQTGEFVGVAPFSPWDE